MEELITYIINDTRCELAIQDLRFSADHFRWVGAHLDLFLEVSYGGNSLPLIANCNFEGRHFKNISHFHRLFLEIRGGIEDPF